MSAWTFIAQIEVPSGGQASIEFSSIPQTYTDLLIVHSLRSNRADATGDNLKMSINGQGFGTNITTRTLYGTGSGVGSFTAVVSAGGVTATSNGTSNTFGNNRIYIPNYTSSVAKSISVDGVGENNGTESYQYISASLWNQTAAITSIELDPDDGSLLLEYSSATLWGITKGSSGGVSVS